MKILSDVMQPFIWHPERVMVVAFFFSLLYFGLVLSKAATRVRVRPILIAAIAWALYSAWEYHCKIQRYNIRVDLLLIYPLLVIVSLLPVVAIFRKQKKQ